MICHYIPTKMAMRFIFSTCVVIQVHAGNNVGLYFAIIFNIHSQTKAKIIYIFYIHGSVHRNSILIRSNKMQQHAGIYLLQNHSTCFGGLSHPSSGVHKIVTAASGTGHSI